MIRQTMQNTIQNTIRSTLGDDAFNILDLFTGGRQGVWYSPSDLTTLYQTSTGSTPVTADGQPVGLVLDKSQGLGVKNTASTWINASWDTFTPTGTGFTASKDSAGGVDLCYSTQTFPATLGKLYKVTIDVDTTTLFDYQVLLSSTTNSRSTTSSFNGSGVKTGYVLANVASGNFSIQVKTTRVGAITVNSVSIEEVLGIHASQPVATQRPTYNDNPDRLTLDLVDDSLAFTVPTGGWDGYMVVGTDQGTASYGVSLPAGAYDLGGDYFFGNSINGVAIFEGDVSDSDLKKVEAEFVKNGAKASYGDVTDFSYAWARNNLTSFPLIDTSSGTNFSYAWYSNGLTSFPALDFSNSASFNKSWLHCNFLTDFPANVFDNCSATNFQNAFFNTNLSQESIDNILVSIASNGTSNGTFNQSGGSAPSEAGEAAIDALVTRGWAVTVTGGYKGKTLPYALFENDENGFWYEMETN